ncbi:MAG: hypothetical protein JSS49_07755 [Planctomycetes bacterium]|nr:hypothetical protein [Planctomycetota bacterium]
MKAKPADPALRFLLGYHYAYLGYPQQAVDRLNQVVAAAPQDELATQLRDEMQAKLPKPATTTPATLSAPAAAPVTLLAPAAEIPNPATAGTRSTRGPAEISLGQPLTHASSLMRPGGEQGKCRRFDGIDPLV